MARALSALTSTVTNARPASAVSSRRFFGMLPTRRSLHITATESVGTASTTTAASNNSDSATSGTSCVTYRGKQFLVPKGTKLRTALLLHGMSPHNGKAQLINCRGLGTCGTCAVQIIGEVLPKSWNTREQLRLNFPPHKAPNNLRLRLACQVSCQGAELEVIKRDKFWGHGDTVLSTAGPDDYSLPLGQLEFLLDSDWKDI